MPTDSYAVSISDVRDAQTRITDYVHRTPVLTCGTMDRLARRTLFFKCENFQKIGAFKIRGATNAIAQLTDDELARGVVTHSSGNHAQAVALAAAHRGATAHIVMPSTAPKVKRRAVLDYGARVYPCEPTLAARDETANRIIAETNAVFVPPFDHAHIIAGQGTMALELLEEVPDLDAIIAPVGGGGMLSGISIAAKGANADIAIYAGEPAGADDAARSLASRQLVPSMNPQSIADGLLTGLGNLTWPIIRDHVADIFTVTDDEIIAALRLVWERMKLVIEPSAAVPLAAILTPRFQEHVAAQRIGVIFSGGNVDLDRLPWM